MTTEQHCLLTASDLSTAKQVSYNLKSVVGLGCVLICVVAALSSSRVFAGAKGFPRVPTALPDRVSDTQ